MDKLERGIALLAAERGWPTDWHSAVQYGESGPFPAVKATRRAEMSARNDAQAGVVELERLASIA
jgi:hypothetical protein